MSSILLILIYQLTPINAQTQDASIAEPLDAYFSKTLPEWKVPGMAIAIVKGDEVVLAKGYGVRHIEEGGRVDENTLFAVASNTKAFTAAALAILADEGRITWDDLVIRHLPYFQLYSPYVTHEMRIRDLLSHRSGLKTYSGDLLWYGSVYSSEEVVRRARFLEPDRLFRGEYGYSNIMFIAAGLIIPSVSGQGWTEFIQQRILDPLGMTHTVMSVEDLEGHKNVATPHYECERNLIACRWYNWDNTVPAGGIISCAADMAKWIELQLNRGSWGDSVIFSQAASREMWTPHISISISEEDTERFPSTHFKAYGLGWGLMDYQGRKVMSHGGGYDGMYSRLALVPEENLGMVILTNSMTSLPRALMYKILDSYFGAEEYDWSTYYLQKDEKHQQKQARERAEFEAERIQNTAPSLPLKDYTGTYGGEMYGDATVTMKDGRLALQFLPTLDLAGDLSHWHFDTFVIKWNNQFPWFGEGTVQFLMDQTGKVTEMKVHVPNDDF